MIPVTKAYLPNKDKYKRYVDRIFESAWLTNNGVLHQELETRLKSYLNVKNLILVANGSLALQLAYKALGLKGEVITTPFSFVATTNTLCWEGLKPVFADINPCTFNIDLDNIETLITPDTSAIVPVHVFGNPCDVEKIESIASRHKLKVIYDAAHAFDSKFKNQSVLNYGDVSTLSFHATKLFHSIEGGAIITNDDGLAHRIRMLTNFGIEAPELITSSGINAKMNEFEAAMGLCVLDEIEYVKQRRADIWGVYEKELSGALGFQEWNEYGKNNHAYAPILFESESELLKIESSLKSERIIPRRYFYPSLDKLEYLETDQYCNHSRDIASRILCLPIYPSLMPEEQKKVIKGILK